MEHSILLTGNHHHFSRPGAAMPEPLHSTPEPQFFRSYPGSGSAPEDLFKLRYDVYCVERAYLKPDAAPGGLERDDYDDCATHFAAYASDDALIGTVRLVTPAASREYPFERHCTTFQGFRKPPHDHCGEVSRLAVRRSHRRRRADCLLGIPGIALSAAEAGGAGREADRRQSPSPMLLLGMYREMYRHSRSRGIRFWYAAMERSLAHSLKRMGFQFEPIGPAADYYGKVTPYMLDLGSMMPGLDIINPPLRAWLEEAPAPTM
jgi:N-acyl amino acid synthase of PEP-CTERM/exosortase system